MSPSEEAKKRSNETEQAIGKLMSKANFPEDLLQRFNINKKVLAARNVGGLSGGFVYYIEDRYWHDWKGWAVMLSGKSAKSPEFFSVSLDMSLCEFLEHVEAGAIFPVNS
jgi:hypothetical protein